MITIKNNEKSLIKASMILLILAVIFSFGINSVSADSSIIYVNDSSGNDDWDGQYAEWIVDTLSGPKKSIKNATGTVTQGGTVNIADGNYIGENNTNITINKNMSITGQSTEGTIINGTDTAQIFIIQNGINVKIQNLTICNGTAGDDETYGYGGAIDNNGTLTVENIIFYGNLADFGGAIYNEANLTVNDSIFIENVGYYGGAIANDGNLTINRGEFIGNFAVFYTEDPEVVDYGYGGAIFNDGNLTVINGNFTENVADFGGAITSIGNLTVINGNFTDNYANWGAGAIYTTGGSINIPVIISNSNFTGNFAPLIGGAIVNEGNLTVNRGNFTDNIANYDIGDDGYYGDNYYRDGGAIYNIGTLTVTDSNFLNNIAGNFGGTICNNANGNCTITGCTMSGSTSTLGYGGAIFNGDDCNLNLTDSTIMGCTTKYGGAIHCNEGSHVTVNRCNFIVNGCAINNQGGILTVNDSKFINNTAGWGGAIYNSDGSYSAGVYHNGILTVTKCTFTGNTATYYGSGAAIYNSGTCILTGSNITDNNGVAIYTTDGNVQIHFNRIFNNTGSDIWGIGNIDATNNWWGTNFQGTDPMTAGRVSTNPNISSNINTSTWLILSLNASPSSILLGSTSTITADLQHDNFGTYYDPVIYGSVPDGILLNFETTMGTINDSTIVKGIAQSLLNAGSTLGVANVSVTVDDETVNKLVTIIDTPSSPPDFRIDTVITNSNTATGITNYPVKGTIKNYGGSVIGTFYVSYYLSKDTIKSSDDRYIGHAAINGLAGGSSINAEILGLIPKDIAQGNYYIIAVADVTGVIPESNEVNNVKSSSSTIFVWRPDLRVNSVTTSGNTATGITNYSVISSIQNYGSITKDTFYVSYYLSKDTTKSSDDRYIGHATVNGLNGWSSTNAQFNCTIPKDIAQGNYYIIAMADVTGVIPESYETNNNKASTSSIFVWRPEMSIQTVTTSGNTAVGMINYTVTGLVKNNGSAIPNTFYVSYYLSTDAAKSSNDLYIGHAIVNGLNGWSTKNATASCSIPSNIAQGYYYVIAVADVTGIVPESNEANNIKASNKIFISKPDLSVDTVFTSGNAVIGQGYYMDSWIKHDGPGFSGNFYVSYYLSTDATKSSNDLYIGHGTVNGLDGWSIKNAAAFCNIPSNIAQGYYYIIAVADSTGIVGESNESNNAKASSDRIYITKT